MTPSIRSISFTATYPLRHAILRTGMPPESAIFPQDDDPSSLHLGAFADERLVGVTSLYVAPCTEWPARTPAWQLRGMATLPAVRGAGFGVALVHEALRRGRQLGGDILWCNARTPAVPFYEKLGLVTLGPEFEIPTAGPHFRMWRELQ